MNTINPVVLVFGGFMTLFAGVGIWTFATALLTRKSDVKQKDTNALTALEKESREFREEIRRDLSSARREIQAMKTVFIPLVDTLDDLLPKMIQCLSEDERILLRDRVNAAKLRT